MKKLFVMSIFFLVVLISVFYMIKIRILYDDAVVELKLGNIDAAIMMLEKANKWGPQEARSLLAEMYAVGDFLHRDRNKAIIYYKKIRSSRQRVVLNIILYHLDNPKSEKYDFQEAQFWRSYLIQE